jgi:Putative transmembrane protein (PGPGW)
MAQHNRKAQNGKTWRDTATFRWSMLILGWFLIIAAPLLGPLPGPGAMLIFPVGLAIILKNSLWAKKRYARFARTHTAYAHWANWAMRRSKVKARPPFPDVKGDMMYMFRRDDLDAKLD